MSEDNQPSNRTQTLVRMSILVMLILFIMFPFMLEVRISLSSYPETHLSGVTIYAWTWVYRLVGYETGFILDLPFYRLVQEAIFQTISQIFFLGAYIGFSLGLTERKTAVNFGIISLIPAHFVLAVNLCGVFMSEIPSLIAPIPIQAISFLGLIILRMTAPKLSKEPWVTE